MPSGTRVFVCTRMLVPCLVLVVVLSVTASPATASFDGSSPSAYSASAVLSSKDGSLTLVTPAQPSNPLAVANGFVNDTISTTGWVELTVEGNPSFVGEFGDDVGNGDDVTKLLQASRGMGYLEGALTHRRMFEAHTNWIAASRGGNKTMPTPVADYMDDQWQWMKTNVDRYVKDDAVTPDWTDGSDFLMWFNVAILLEHVDGMAEGYNSHHSTGQELSWLDVYTLTMAGDLEDLLPALTPKAEAELVETQIRPADHMDCSGLVAFDTETNEVFVGHTTFNGYAYMLRVFKHYVLNIPHTPATKISFSSRPGDLNSKDDFYLLDSGLVVIETSLSVINKTLYEALTPRTLPCWLRGQLANRMADDSESWSDVFKTHHSGTHNNQWIVTDYNKMTENGPLPGTVWLLEEMVEYVEARDVTVELLMKNGYVPGYNIPYFSFIFNVSGYRDAGFSYDHDPRANIFRRDHVKARDLESIAALMNSNDWENDPLSLNSSCNAISARCDLLEEGAYAFGGIDAKVVTKSEVESFRVYAISGQTHQEQPVFEFEPKWTSTPHAGMPNSWDFDWTWMSPAHFEKTHDHVVVEESVM